MCGSAASKISQIEWSPVGTIQATIAARSITRSSLPNPSNAPICSTFAVVPETAAVVL